MQCINKLPPPTNSKKPRNSNLELYRIIVMLLIIAHHYVVNSGLYEAIREAPMTASSSAMLLFGAWGKTGINCFVLITGYFMCKSAFSWEKLLKLYLQITFYAVIIYCIFCWTGHESFHPVRALKTLIPVKVIASDFTSSFLLFYLFIPFLNIFISHINKSQHRVLLLLLLTIYTVLPSIHMHLSFNYVSWFISIYMIASYIRIYGLDIRLSHRGWGILTLSLIVLSAASILGLFAIYKLGYTTKFAPYYLVADSNKIFAIAIAVSSFMWFKDLKMPYSKLINAVGATTFGVLLIHANSDAMRTWLWGETVDTVGHFGESLLWTLGYATVSVIVVFVICSGIDWFRGKLIEPKLMRFFTSKSFIIKEKIKQNGLI